MGDLFVFYPLSYRYAAGERRGTASLVSLLRCFLLLFMIYFLQLVI